ncbi:Dig1p SCDLUD_001965 [Saccharomycodes ludwigii]|uniref:Dig1p n=1 Tax=Saccharomycodes ludwigii TaxID=36035 RepID=UPI001E8B100C|nr:hypothetical protein SCDLUD_001965 [Saccharomycodes ludwigii]KAH3902152.1 hypothetical protein SCDLUD_001965 [Saccharomycodes ludwigii]
MSNNNYTPTTTAYNNNKSKDMNITNMIHISGNANNTNTNPKIIDNSNNKKDNENISTKTIKTSKQFLIVPDTTEKSKSLQQLGLECISPGLPTTKINDEMFNRLKYIAKEQRETIAKQTGIQQSNNLGDVDVTSTGGNTRNTAPDTNSPTNNKSNVNSDSNNDSASSTTSNTPFPTLSSNNNRSSLKRSRIPPPINIKGIDNETLTTTNDSTMLNPKSAPPAYAAQYSNTYITKTANTKNHTYYKNIAAQSQPQGPIVKYLGQFKRQKLDDTVANNTNVFIEGKQFSITATDKNNNLLQNPSLNTTYSAASTTFPYPYHNQQYHSQLHPLTANNTSNNFNNNNNIQQPIIPVPTPYLYYPPYYPLYNAIPPPLLTALPPQQTTATPFIQLQPLPHNTLSTFQQYQKSIPQAPAATPSYYSLADTANNGAVDKNTYSDSGNNAVKNPNSSATTSTPINATSQQSCANINGKTYNVNKVHADEGNKILNNSHTSNKKEKEKEMNDDDDEVKEEKNVGINNTAKTVSTTPIYGEIKIFDDVFSFQFEKSDMTSNSYAHVIITDNDNPSKVKNERNLYNLLDKKKFLKICDKIWDEVITLDNKRDRKLLDNCDTVNYNASNIDDVDVAVKKKHIGTTVMPAEQNTIACSDGSNLSKIARSDNDNNFAKSTQHSETNKDNDIKQEEHEVGPDDNVGKNRKQCDKNDIVDNNENNVNDAPIVNEKPENDKNIGIFNDKRSNEGEKSLLENN